jgi:hypothetical protein
MGLFKTIRAIKSRAQIKTNFHSLTQIDNRPQWLPSPQIQPRTSTQNSKLAFAMHSLWCEHQHSVSFTRMCLRVSLGCNDFLTSCPFRCTSPASLHTHQWSSTLLVSQNQLFVSCAMSIKVSLYPVFMLCIQFVCIASNSLRSHSFPEY